MKQLFQWTWEDLYLQIIEMQMQIKFNYLDSGFKIGKNGKDLKSKIKFN